MAFVMGSESWSLKRCYRYCEQVARREAANFYHAFRLLPKQQRVSMCALYAFLRVSDDLADADGGVDEKQRRLDDWRQRLHLAMAGEPDHPILVALRDTVDRHEIPSEYLDAALDGVCMDLTVTRYQTFQELYDYCYKVASVVGLCCVRVWGFDLDHRAEVLRLAEQAGIAFQLTNVLRDLPEDAARGRIYLPQEDLHRLGYSEEELGRGELNDRFEALMRFQVERVRSYYSAAEPLAPLLSRSGRTVFLVMLRTYRALLGVIERRGYDVFADRARVSRWTKARLVLQALPIRWGLW